METLEIMVTDRRSIKKMQRMVLILQRIADMLHEYEDIEIIIKCNPKKRWWQIR